MIDSITFQIFAKAPIAGRVKTRLVPPLSPSSAARLHARMIERAAVMVREAMDRLDDGNVSVHGELWCAIDGPSDATLASPSAIDDPILTRIARDHRLDLRIQCNGDLGDRMRHALSSALPGRVLLLGTDIPSLASSHVVAAANLLTDHDALVIPADDGGYVLIGCNGRVPECFDAIPWSTPRVIHATRAQLQASGCRWVELPPLWDVDTVAELRRLAADPLLAPLLDGLETNQGFPLVFNETQTV